jgi:hypothetical protein
MKTLTTIQALATLAALGSAILGSATPADARGGGFSFGGHASLARPSFARPGFGRPPAVIAARQQPPAVIAAQLAHPGHVNPGSTSMIAHTPNGPVFVPPVADRRGKAEATDRRVAPGMNEVTRVPRSTTVAGPRLAGRFA